MIDTLTTSWRRAGTLRSGLTAKEAADRLWLLTTVEYHLAAVDRLGWTPQAHERWLVEVAERELLEPASESEGSSSRRGRPHNGNGGLAPSGCPWRARSEEQSGRGEGDGDEGGVERDHPPGPLPADLEAWLAALPVLVSSEETILVGGVEARAWQLTLDEEAFLATTGEPGLLILATYDGELTTEGSGGRASIVGLPPEPGSTLGLVEWTRADDRLLLAWFSWDGTDYTEFLVSVMAGAGPS